MQYFLVYKSFTAKITTPTHRRTDANLYPLERQLTKASEPSFDLEEGPKVKSDIRRFSAHDILQVGLTLQTTRINNKCVISTFWESPCPLDKVLTYKNLIYY